MPASEKPTQNRKTVSLFDHLVGAGERSLRNSNV